MAVKNARSFVTPGLCMVKMRLKPTIKTGKKEIVGEKHRNTSGTACRGVCVRLPVPQLTMTLKVTNSLVGMSTKQGVNRLSFVMLGRCMVTMRLKPATKTGKKENAGAIAMVKALPAASA